MQRTRAFRLSIWASTWFLVCLTVELLAPMTAIAAIGAVAAEHAVYFPELRHNIPNLLVERDGQIESAPFWDVYISTGALTRWGFPTSEVLEEEEGHLTQYYQRGVLDWHRSSTCGTRSGYCIERRLVWDAFGGGAEGSIDMGVEPGIISQRDGRALGPWGHKVSDWSIDGTFIRFRQFFERYGDVGAFGYPKTDARSDTNPSRTLFIDPRISGTPVTPNFIRQYFQAGVMEFHDGDPEPVKLRLLGDDLRNRLYAGEAWKAYRSFRDAEPLRDGAVYAVEHVSKGPRVTRGRIIELHPITEVCAATTWQFRRPPAPPAPYCGRDAFRTATLGQMLQTGDVVETRNASPDLDVAAIVETIAQGVVDGILALATGVRAQFDSVIIERGEVGVLTSARSTLEMQTPAGVLLPRGAVALLNVQPGGTTVKVVEGTVQVRGLGRTHTVPIPAGQQTMLQAGRDPAPVPSQPLTPGETARLQRLQQLKPRLGNPPGAVSTCTSPLTDVQLGIVSPPGSLKAELVWKASGGCAPIQGTITARYAAQTAPYASHQVSGPGGQIADEAPLPPSCDAQHELTYTITLTDAAGGRVSDTASRRITAIC